MPQLSAIVAVLDDEPEMRKALRRLLLTKGFRVEVHARGEELLESLSTGLPDCLLLDIHMPGVNGFDVLAALASRQITTPVVVITGHDEPDTEERVRSLGAVAYLRKPVDETTLFSAIEKALASSVSPIRDPK
jgi:FixJ family two-component response regulator